MAHQADRPSLTDRYVWAATRRLPEAQRADVEAELRTTIADMIDTRLGATGADASAFAVAESAALTELGDPALLAQGYRGRPDYLIGPDFYGDYLRLLKLLLAIVPAAAGGGVALASILGGEGVVDALISGAGVAFVAAVNVAFWATLGFAIAERSGARPIEHGGHAWEPSRLPELPSAGRITPGDAIGSAVVGALLIVAILWQRDASWLSSAGGEPVPLLNPDQWAFWLPFVIVVIAAGVVLDLVRLWRGRWSVPLAVATTVLDALLVIPFLGLLGAGPMINPAFIAEVDAVTASTVAGDVIEQLVTLGIVAVALVDAIEAWVGVRRAHRSKG